MSMIISSGNNKIHNELFTTEYENLYKKLDNNTANIAVIGLGYVGLPNVVAKAKLGYNVTGFDLDIRKIEQINSGVSYIGDVESFELRKLVKEGLITATNNFTELYHADVITICVPTPIDEYKQPDLSYVISAVDSIAENISFGTLVMLESTTYPGTTEEIIVKALEDKGYIIGENIFVAYSPERIDPSNSYFNVENTPRVVGGHTKKCTSIAEKFIGDNVTTVSSTKVAEMAKVYENTFRYVNIGLADELALISDKMGIDVWEVIEAAKTKPFGFMPFYPSSGVGGHCIPVDPYYLLYKAKQYDYNAKMIEAAGELDIKMKEYTVSKVYKILNDMKKPIKDAKIGILGVTYKKDVADVRESAIFKLLEEFEKFDANITLFDPYVSQVRTSSKNYEVLPIEYEKLSDLDISIILTNHSQFDYEKIFLYSPVVFDTKNVKKQSNVEGQYYKL